MLKRGLILFFIPCIALAQEWKGEGELGYTTTSGNTNSENLVTKLGISREYEKWLHKAEIDALKSSTDNVTSANNFVFKEKSEYRFGEKAYAFGKLRYEDDKFSGFDYQAALSFGVGSRILQNDPHTLDASIGIGMRTNKDTATQLTHDETIATADAKYAYIISSTATFTEELLIENGEDNRHSESLTSLKTKINGNLSSKIGYQLKHNSDVPVGTEKTDKITTVTLVYSF